MLTWYDLLHTAWPIRSRAWTPILYLEHRALVPAALPTKSPSHDKYTASSPLRLFPAVSFFLPIPAYSCASTNRKFSTDRLLTNRHPTYCRPRSIARRRLPDLPSQIYPRPFFALLSSSALYSGHWQDCQTGLPKGRPHRSASVICKPIVHSN